MPEVDVAAALAAVMHGEQPLLLEPEPERATRSFDERPDATAARPQRGRPPRSRAADVPMATYRIAVGKRHKVEPRQIVGALANEGGLSRGDFGYIPIKPDFSLVELPADLPAGTLDGSPAPGSPASSSSSSPTTAPRGSAPRWPRRRLQGQEPPP